MGGGDEIDGQVAPGFKFEDIDVSERRVDFDESVGADEPVDDLPGHPATADVPTPVEKCWDGEDLPGMELDLVDGNPTDVSSSVIAAIVSDSPRLEGGQVEPVVDARASLMSRPGVVGSGCSETHTDLFDEVDQSQSYDDLSMRDLMKMMNQAEAEEAKELNREILSLVTSLGGDSAKYRCVVRAAVSEIYFPPCLSTVAKVCPSLRDSSRLCT